MEKENKRKLRNYFSYLFLDLLHQIGGKVNYNENEIIIIKPSSHMWMGAIPKYMFEYDFIKFNSNDYNKCYKIVVDLTLSSKMFYLIKQKQEYHLLIILLSVKHFQDQRRKFMETVGRELIKKLLHPANIHKFLDWGFIEDDGDGDGGFEQAP